jgi:hypothetical protein
MSTMTRIVYTSSVQTSFSNIFSVWFYQLMENLEIQTYFICLSHVWVGMTQTLFEILNISSHFPFKTFMKKCIILSNLYLKILSQNRKKKSNHFNGSA